MDFSEAGKKTIALPELPMSVSSLPPISIVKLPNIDISNMIKYRKENQDQISESNFPSFSIRDDLSILRAIKLFYGSQFKNKISSSFWKLFIKSTDSDRSVSELCTHWNYMVRKYNIGNRRIDECIDDINQRIEDERAFKTHKAIKKETGHSMIHVKSHQGMPPEFEHIINKKNFNDNISGNKNTLTHVNTARPKVYSLEAPVKFMKIHSSPISRTTKKIAPFSSFLEQ